MDFEWHLISFCHGGVVHKQVAQLPVKKRSGKVREEVLGDRIAHLSFKNSSPQL